MMKKSILYFKNQEIDKKKWDHAIRHSVNNIMYAYSWYLDMVSPGWDALIQGDYDVVMPVTWHKKWGVKFLMQPMFAKMLGIFSNQQLGKDVIKEFIDEVKKKYFLGFFSNYDTIDDHAEGLLYEKKYYQVLDLNKPYKEIHENYSKSNLKNIRRAIRNDVTIISEPDINNVLLFRRNIQEINGSRTITCFLNGL